jgi:hypothetical protein
MRRARIEAADLVAIQVIRETSRALTERMRRPAVPRPETLAGVGPAWRITMPPFGRIS